MSASESYVGKYTKQKLLGKGTFGEAWLVVSNASGRCFLLFEIRLLSGGGTVAHIMYRLCTTYQCLYRSYVMKELSSLGWETKEKDANMTEVEHYSIQQP